MTDIKDTLKRLVGTPELSVRKGIDLFQTGQYSEALQCFEKALQISPHHTEALIWKGRSLKRTGQFDAAIQCFDEVLRLNPGNITALFSKGLSLVYRGDIEDGLRLFKRVVELKPDFADAWDNVAACYKLLNENELSETALETAMRIRGEYKGTKSI